MAVIEVVKGGQKIENVVITTPQPITPTGALPPDIGYVEIGTSEDRGSIWMTGQGPPTEDAGQAGDMYLDMDTGDVWQWNGTEWELQGTFAPSTDTPEEVLAKIITVDGEGSGLDADTLDGHDSTYFATASGLALAESDIDVLEAEVDAVAAENDQQDIDIAGKANAVHTHPQTDITNLVSDLALKAPLASPALTGNPTAPTPSPGDADTSIATTAFVGAALAALPPSGIGEAPLDGKTYGRQSAAWAAVVGGAIISDTPPASPQVGQMWFESDSGNTFIWYADADSAQWVQVNIQPAIATNPNAGMTAQTRNRLVNPSMQISQEWGNTAGNSSGFYAADQWMLGFVSSSAVASARRPRTVGGFDFLATWTSPLETAAAAGEYVYSTQSIEGTRLADFGLGTAGSKAFVISFDAKMTVAGTYWVTIRNSPVTHSFLASYTISAGEVGAWVRKSVIVPAGAISAGTWTVDTTAGMLLAFTFHCGSTFTGVAGFQSGNMLAGPGQALGLSVAASDAVAIANVGLYLDPLATGLAPRWEMPDEAQELLACQRYYYKTVATGISFPPRVANAGTVLLNFGVGSRHPVTMRAIPAMSIAWEQNDVVQGGGLGNFSAAIDSWNAAPAIPASSNLDVISSIGNARM